MGIWTQTEIAGKNADLFEPSRRSESKYVVLFLHGHGRILLRDNATFTSELDRYALRAICPHGQRSWWADRICAEFDAEQTPLRYLHDRLLPWVAEAWGIQPPAIGVTGVSMGGQGALRLAYRYPQEFPVVAAISPTIDFQTYYGRGLPLDGLYADLESARQDTVTMLLHPLNWPRHQLLVCDPADPEWIEGVERLASKLSSTGIPFERDFSTRHGGHSWEYFNHMAPQVMKFLSERLEQESRRVV